MSASCLQLLERIAGQELEALIWLLQKFFFLKPVAAWWLSAAPLGGAGGCRNSWRPWCFMMLLCWVCTVWCVRRGWNGTAAGAARGWAPASDLP